MFVPTKFRPPAVQLWLLLTTIVLALPCVAQDSGTQTFAVQIAPSQNASSPGEATWKKKAPVYVIVTLTNNSAKTLHFTLTNAAFDYRISVKDKDGNPVAETPDHRNLKDSVKSGSAQTRTTPVTLEPQQNKVDAFEVSYLYEMAKPGDYTVQIERDLPAELGAGKVQSNTLALKITK
jgi:hypothetical protein